jgi:hypothetical protein
MVMTNDLLVAAFNAARQELHNTLVLTRNLYYGIDFAWLGYIDDDQQLQLLSGVVCMSLDENADEFGGESGRFRFQRRRLADQNGEILDWLLWISAGHHDVKEGFQTVKMQVRPNMVTVQQDALHGLPGDDDLSGDIVYVVCEPLPQAIANEDWTRLDADLRSGRATTAGSILNRGELYRDLDIPDAQNTPGLRVHLPRRGSLRGTRASTGELTLHVGLPANAELQHARLQVYRGDSRRGQSVPLKGMEKVQRGRDCEVTIPWEVGESGRDRIDLFYADRRLAEGHIADISPQAHAYLRLDEGAKELRTVLLPTSNIENAGHVFESACGTLLALLGFRVTPLSRLGLQGDWLAEYGVNGTLLQFLVEASVALKKQVDLVKLAENATHLCDGSKINVPPAMFTSIARGSNLKAEGAAASYVRLVYRPDLEALLDLALDTTTVDRTGEAFRRITGLSIV